MGENRPISFCRSALKEIKQRAEEHARQFPPLKHMLVLPENRSISVPVSPSALRLGLDGVWLEAGSAALRRIQNLLPFCFWPAKSQAGRLLVILDPRGRRRASLIKPRRVCRVHAFFGDLAGIKHLSELASDLMNLRVDLAQAWFPSREYDEDPVFCTSSVGDVDDETTAALDCWLCTVHWWAWKAPDASIPAALRVVLDGRAYSADRSDKAVTDRLSFSPLDGGVFRATVDTVDLFLRFFHRPPDWSPSTDYPPQAQPEPVVPLDESTRIRIQRLLEALRDLDLSILAIHSHRRSASVVLRGSSRMPSTMNRRSRHAARSLSMSRTSCRFTSADCSY